MRTAHNLGVKVDAHAHGNKGVIAALKAGVDSIDHGTFSDAEAMKLFKQTGAYLVPTLSPSVKIPATIEGNPFSQMLLKLNHMPLLRPPSKLSLTLIKLGLKLPSEPTRLGLHTEKILMNLL